VQPTGRVLLDDELWRAAARALDRFARGLRRFVKAAFVAVLG
jgi:hypothetical protein